MTVLVVTAHPDKNSFTHTWAKESVAAVKNLGHEVLLSDIYTMQFDPRLAEHKFTPSALSAPLFNEKSNLSNA